jgi:hypothetical protein
MMVSFDQTAPLAVADKDAQRAAIDALLTEVYRAVRATLGEPGARAAWDKVPRRRRGAPRKTAIPGSVHARFLLARGIKSPPGTILSARTLLSGPSEWFDGKLISPEKFAKQLFAEDPATARQLHMDASTLARELRRIWIQPKNLKG